MKPIGLSEIFKGGPGSGIRGHVTERDKPESEVFAAALRGYHKEKMNTIIRDADRGKPKELQNDELHKEGNMLNFAGAQPGIDSNRPIEVIEQNKAGGFWYNSNTKKYEGEPSFNTVVKGNQEEIEKRACILGKKYDQDMVIVAHYDKNAKDSGVYVLDMYPRKVGNSNKPQIAKRFLDAGVGGATAFFNGATFKLVAGDRDSMKTIEKVTAQLPKSYRPKLTFYPAVTKFIGKEEYGSYISKSIKPGTKGISEIFIMGLGKSKK
jgi:hypothetical protein